MSHELLNQALREISAFVTTPVSNEADTWTLDKELDCKELIFDEVITQRFFPNLDLEVRHLLHHHLSDHARASESFTRRDQATINALIGLNEVYFSYSSAMKFLQTSLEIDKSSFASLALFNYALFGTEQELDLPAVHEISSEEDLLMYGAVSDALLVLSDQYESFRNGLPVMVTKESIEEMFYILIEDHSTLSTAMAINAAQTYNVMGFGSNLANHFTLVRGDCIAFDALLITGLCQQMEFRSAVEDREFQQAEPLFEVSNSTLQRINAHASLIRSVLDLIHYRSEFSILAADSRVLRPPPTALAEQLQSLINDANEREDVISAVHLTLALATRIVGIEQQNHIQAYQLIKGIEDLGAGQFGQPFFTQLQRENAWREYYYGDTQIALALMVETHEEREFYDAYQEISSLTSLSGYFEESGLIDQAEDYRSMASALFNSEISNANSLSDVDAVLEKLSQNNLIWLIPSAIQKMDEIILSQEGTEDDIVQIFRVSTKAVSSLYWGLKSQPAYVELNDMLVNETLNSVQDRIAAINSLSEDLVAELTDEIEALDRIAQSLIHGDRVDLDQAMERLTDHLFRNQSNENRSLESAVASEMEWLQQRWGESGERIVPFHSILTRQYAIYFARYFEQFDRCVFIEHTTEGPRCTVMMNHFELIPEHTEYLEAALELWQFGYRADSSFSTSLPQLFFAALAAELTGNVTKGQSLMEDAFNIVDTDEGAFRPYWTQYVYDVNIISVHARNLARECRYIEALEIVDQHTDKFRGLDEMIPVLRNLILEQNDLHCSR